MGSKLACNINPSGLPFALCYHVLSFVELIRDSNWMPKTKNASSLNIEEIVSTWSMQ